MEGKCRRPGDYKFLKKQKIKKYAQWFFKKVSR